MIRPMRVTSFVCCLALAACWPMEAFGEDAGKPAEGAQGIDGQVVKLSGNFLPGPGPASGRTVPLQVPVHIFRGSVETFQKPDPDHPQLVAIAQADKDGRFRTPLEPGVYTAVAVIDGRMYLNVVQFKDGKAVWASLTVEAGRWAVTRIDETTDAAF